MEFKIRDEKIKRMISTTGGVSRKFVNKKRKKKSDKVGRKAKHKGMD